ncbi:hypothetical protein CONPUDRAFT_150479 [Coniophora puteana RWD-64-598 SS2]|uniref:Uncharacterized protein n=1 Tax=Coniophora puteana (strain RWD-64-598) TaxID=741705 RepID=A0A5M3N2R6_CONPW|nr:uncharacterized protein CONPUDRAFT_150479 [Coniophora puteana RWD-64-598 SS2]EIW85680.1 hypothetical protein CONPUDRAFT_150479 [Coniophora puteana RWD-64-598 SS2]
MCPVIPPNPYVCCCSPAAPRPPQRDWQDVQFDNIHAHIHPKFMESELKRQHERYQEVEQRKKRDERRNKPRNYGVVCNPPLPKDCTLSPQAVQAAIHGFTPCQPVPLLAPTYTPRPPNRYTWFTANGQYHWDPSPRWF